jgi:hypothetical protein
MKNIMFKKGFRVLFSFKIALINSNTLKIKKIMVLNLLSLFNLFFLFLPFNGKYFLLKQLIEMCISKL